MEIKDYNNETKVEGQTNRQFIWKCDGNDRRIMPAEIWEKGLNILSRPEEMKDVLLKWREIENRKEIVLPMIQNLEGAALGASVIKRRDFWTTGEYPFSSLEEINPDDFDIMNDIRIQAVLEVIKLLKGEITIFEMEAPFSVLSALINPMELYFSMQTQSQKLNDILIKIAEEEIKYLEAVVGVGCRIISLAEPTGTIDMVGEKCFRECSGRAVSFLLKESQRFLSQSVIHLCGKLSHSMLTLDMATVRDYPIESEDYLENLLEAADNPEIYFIGQRCIHQKRNTTGKIQVLNYHIID